MIREAATGRCLIGRLDCGADLLDALTRICVKEGVTLGRVAALGAVQKARVGFYNQAAREYEFLDIEKELEILGVIGNVSIKDGQAVIHAHITLSDREGQAFGGHLAPGTIVFACEYMIQEMTGM